MPALKTPTLESSIHELHELLEKKHSADYTNALNWVGSDLDDQIYSAWEELCSFISPLLNHIGIDANVMHGSDTEFNLEGNLIYLNDEDKYYGCLLITETGYEWRKKGFNPIVLKDEDHILRFIKFLSNKKYRWKEQVGNDTPHLLGIEHKKFYVDAMKNVRDGFIHPFDNDDIYAYVLIGNR